MTRRIRSEGIDWICICCDMVGKDKDCRHKYPAEFAEWNRMLNRKVGDNHRKVSKDLSSKEGDRQADPKERTG